MDITKVRELTDEQVLVELTTARRHLYDLRFQLATRQLTDFSQIAQTRKTIARLLTVQTERGVVGAGSRAGTGPPHEDGRRRRQTMTALAAERATRRKTKVGRVVSDKMDKTIVVSVERLSRHPLYKRVIRLTTKFKAHDERNEARLGDTVLIEESRPLSATKRWRLVEILARAGEALPEGLTLEEDATGRPSTWPPTPAASTPVR